MALQKLQASDLMKNQREKINQAIDVINKIDSTGDGFIDNAWNLNGGMEITENTDLNNLLEVGNYYCRTSAIVKTLKNKPNTIYPFALKTLAPNNDNLTRLVQEVADNNGAKFIRTLKKSADTWQVEEWQQAASTKDVEAVKTIANAAMPKATYDKNSNGKVDVAENAEKFGNQLPSYYATKSEIGVKKVTQTGTNLNNYKTAGSFYFAESFKPSNIPAGSDGWLTVICSDSSAVKQIWYREGSTNTNDFEMYIRTFSLGTWSSWVQMMTSKGGTFTGTTYMQAGKRSGGQIVRGIWNADKDGHSVNTDEIYMFRK